MFWEKRWLVFVIQELEGWKRVPWAPCSGNLVSSWPVVTEAEGIPEEDAGVCSLPPYP